MPWRSRSITNVFLSASADTPLAVLAHAGGGVWFVSSEGHGGIMYDITSARNRWSGATEPGSPIALGAATFSHSPISRAAQRTATVPARVLVKLFLPARSSKPPHPRQSDQRAGQGVQSGKTFHFSGVWSGDGLIISRL